MSGLFGYVEPGGHPDGAGLMSRMGQALSRYEWNETSTLLDETRRVGLGQLGIQVFNRHAAPTVSQDGRVTVLFCGELYRTDHLARLAGVDLAGTHSPAEQVLRLYEQRGRTFLSKLEGIYQLLICDWRVGKLILSNDRFGVYPLEYAAGPGWFVFGPEMSAVLCEPRVRRVIDQTAIAQYVRFQFLLGKHTFLEDIHLLPAAAILTCDLENGALHIETYWDAGYIHPMRTVPAYEEVVQRTGELLRDSVQARLGGDHHVGVYLSGGLDSRTILGLAGKSATRLTTISYGQPESRDMIYSAQLARKAGSRHHSFGFSGSEWVAEYAPMHLSLTDGFHSWIHSHGISVLPTARPLMDVNINGFCGEELNWDDPQVYQEAFLPNYTARLFGLLNQKTTWPSISEGEEGELLDTPLSRSLRGRAFDSLRDLVNEQAAMSPRQRTHYFSYEVDRHLFMYYTVFNRSHIEQRYPYLDYHYIDYIHSLPVNLLFHRRLRRDVIRRFCPEMAGIPTDKDNVPLGANEASRSMYKILERGKGWVRKGFSQAFPLYSTLYADYETWLRDGLREWGADILTSPRALDRGLFNADFVRGLWQGFQTDQEVNIIGKIAPLMTIELVLRKFIDQDSVNP